MKTLTSICLFLMLPLLSFSQEGNYVAIVNGDSLKVDLNKSFDYKTKSGDKITIKLIQPQFLTYTDDFVTFKHAKENNVSNTVLDADIEQLMVMKSTGSGFIVQKYGNIDPSMLTGMMLNEVTKESVSYGYDMKTEEFEKTLKSGHVIKGTKAMLSYKGDTEEYIVASYGQKDEGLMILTMLLNDDFTEPDQETLKLFWDTLEILRK